MEEVFSLGLTGHALERAIFLTHRAYGTPLPYVDKRLKPGF